MKIKRSFGGWTLLEILLVLFVVGALMLIGLPSALKYKADAEVEQVVAKVVHLNTAKTSYLSTSNRRAAETSWASMTNEQRYVALKPFLSFPPPDLGSYITAGYVVEIGDLYSKATIIRSADSRQIEY